MSWLYRARSLLVLPGESVDSCEMREERHEGGEARGRGGTREGRHEVRKKCDIR